MAVKRLRTGWSYEQATALARVQEELAEHHQAPEKDAKQFANKSLLFNNKTSISHLP